MQKDVQSGAIIMDKAAIIRGKVRNATEQKLSGVKVIIKNRDQYGYTLTREDGEFDMMLTGGGSVTLEFSKSGYFPVQRTMKVAWKDFSIVDDVIMTKKDDKVTQVTLSTLDKIAVHTASTVTDASGSRAATIVIHPGTKAHMVMPDGTEQSLDKLDIRISEYTVGEEGPQAMPGELPPTSAYTYAAEFSVDQALTAGAKTVKFNQTVYAYVDNFLNVPVGHSVPVGYYDYDMTTIRANGLEQRMVLLLKYWIL